MDLTPPRPAAAGGGGKRLLLEDDESSSNAAAAAEDDGDKKFILSDDPLDLSHDFPLDYRNWAAVLSQVLLTKESNSAERARSSLRRLMLTAHGHLAKVASGEELIPRFHLQDPVLSAAAGGSGGGLNSLLAPPTLPSFFPSHKNGTAVPPKTTATGFSSSSTFFNYAPCVLSESLTGFSGSVTGLNIIPTLFSLSATHLEADAAVINIQPQLIYLVNKVNQVEPQGFNVQVSFFLLERSTSAFFPHHFPPHFFFPFCNSFKKRSPGSSISDRSEPTSSPRE